MPELFGHMPTGEPVYRVTLENTDLRVQLITFGAAIQSIETPDRTGARANVVLGLTSLADYIARSPHFGAVPGRYAGRIGGGRFTLDGKSYELPCNDGPNTLHGGPNGFGKRAWILADHGAEHATLTLQSHDGDGGFPGHVTVQVSYALAGPELRIDYRADTTSPTIVNLTNHSYFNLGGEGSGSVLGHGLLIEADSFAPIDEHAIPTGQLLSVVDTPFDFRQRHPIGERIRRAHEQLTRGRGYDHAFLLRGAGLRPGATLHDPTSGRTLTVSTTEPAIQLYTANMLTGSLAGPTGRIYRQSDAVCLEAQHFGDSPNRPSFPSTVLRPGTPFKATTNFAFTAN